LFVRPEVQGRKSRGLQVGEFPFLFSSHGFSNILHRLLEVFGALAEIHTVKDTECGHYESLVAEYERLVLVIQQDHVGAAKAIIRDQSIRENLISEIEGECRELIDYRLAAERWKLEIDSRSKDRIVSFGEKLSCRVVAALLLDNVSSAC